MVMVAGQPELVKMMAYRRILNPGVVILITGGPLLLGEPYEQRRRIRDDTGESIRHWRKPS